MSAALRAADPVARSIRPARAARATAPKAIALHQLPPQLRMLVRAMGEGPAFELVKQRGGTMITIPKSLIAETSATALLLALVGAAPAAALVREMGDQRMVLPKYDSVLRQLRHQRVIDLRTTGCDIAQIALTTGYTTRSVIYILNDARLPGLSFAQSMAELQRSGQMDLFDAPCMHGGAALAEALAHEPAPAAHDPFSLAAAGAAGRAIQKAQQAF